MDKQHLIQRVNHLSNKEKVHIFNILRTNSISYSKNSNGYFFNLAEVSKDVLYKLCECLDLMEKNREEVKKLNDDRDNLLKEYKQNIEENLRATLTEKNRAYETLIRLKCDYTEISCTYKRKCKYERIRMFTSSDPDEMILEYKKMMNNAVKDGVYFRILSKIRSKNRKQTHVYDEEGDDREGSDADVDASADIDVEGAEIECDGEGADECEVDNELDELADDNDEGDDEFGDIGMVEGDTECYNMKESDDSFDCNSVEEDETVGDDESKRIQNKIEYYKQLLSKKGYQFDENEKCLLLIEDYIT